MQPDNDDQGLKKIHLGYHEGRNPALRAQREPGSVRRVVMGAISIIAE